MHAETAARQNQIPVARTHSADDATIPEIGKARSGPQLVFLRHTVTTDELTAFSGEQPKARLTDSEQLAQSLEGRVGERQHRRQRRLRLRPYVVQRLLDRRAVLGPARRGIARFVPRRFVVVVGGIVGLVLLA